MKRMSKLLVLVVLIAASATGIAVAASSPTVVTGAATTVTDTTAVLNGRVNAQRQHDRLRLFLRPDHGLWRRHRSTTPPERARRWSTSSGRSPG